MTDAAIIYCRVSTDRQEEEGTSLEDQEQQCRAFALAQGLDVIEVIAESASGKDLHRAGMQRVRDLLDVGAADVLLAYSIDRLTRSQNDIGILYADVVRAGARIECVRERFEDTPDGRFVVSAHAYVAEKERIFIVSRTSKGRRARAREGRYVAARAPYGYRRVAKTTIEPDPDQAPIVRRMYDEYEHNLGLRAIAQGLNRDGIRTRFGVTWAVKQVRDVLTRPAYAGVLVYSGIRVEGAIEPIISPEQWQRVQERMARKAGLPGGRTQTSRFLLTGLLFCGRCHGRMVGDKRGYTCRMHHSGQGCVSNWHNAAALEARVIEDLNDSVAGVGKTAQLASADVERLKRDLAAVTAALARNARRRHNVLQAIADNVYADASQARAASTQVEDERRSLRDAIERTQHALDAAEIRAQHLLAQPAEVRRLLNPDLPRGEAKRILQTYTHHIEVHPGNPEPFILD